MSEPTINLALNTEEFTKLTKGEVIERDGVKIILQDIGYDLMKYIVDKNWHNFVSESLERGVKKIERS